MELMKTEVVEFQFRDIKFLFRSKATVGDKYAIEKLIADALKARATEAVPRLGKEIIKLFLCGWEGVTLDGKPVACSYELIESSFPAEMADELIPALVKFVRESVDILK